MESVRYHEAPTLEQKKRADIAILERNYQIEKKKREQLKRENRPDYNQQEEDEVSENRKMLLNALYDIINLKKQIRLQREVAKKAERDVILHSEYMTEKRQSKRVKRVKRSKREEDDSDLEDYRESTDLWENKQEQLNLLKKMEEMLEEAKHRYSLLVEQQNITKELQKLPKDIQSLILSNFEEEEMELEDTRLLQQIKADRLGISVKELNKILSIQEDF